MKCIDNVIFNKHIQLLNYVIKNYISGHDAKIVEIAKSRKLYTKKHILLQNIFLTILAFRLFVISCLL